MDQEPTTSKVKQGNDPLGLALKKEKLDKANEKPEKQKFILQNTLADNKDGNGEGGNRALNFNTKVAEPQKVQPRTIVFGQNNGNLNNEPTQKKKSKGFTNLFGISQDQNKKNQSAPAPPGNNEQQAQQLQQQQQQQSQQQHNQNQQKVLNFGNQQQIQQNQIAQQPQIPVSTLSQEEVDKFVQEQKNFLTQAGVSKTDFIQGEKYVKQSQISLKLYDYSYGDYKYYDGTLVLTNFMLRFIPSEDKSGEVYKNVERNNYFQIPVGMILKMNRSVEKKGLQYSYIEIQSKDYREFIFRFQPIQQNESMDLLQTLQSLAFPEENKTKFFAFEYNKYNRHLEEQCQGWEIYNCEKEFARMGLQIAPVGVIENQQQQGQYLQNENNFEFRWVDNSKGQICGTYPPLLVVPYNMIDDLLKKVAQFRSRERIPALSYAIKNPIQNGNSQYIALYRCAQGRGGIGHQNRSFEDEKYFRIIGDPTDTNRQEYNCHIFDARPKINAMSNQLAGKGYESTENYRNCQISFLNIGNIHKVRDAQKILMKAINSETSKYFSLMDKSGYFEIISAILEGAVKIVQKMRKGINVVLHCSDGWDRTSQLCSLAQIIMDPYFRTIEGFQVLIEKEWVSFGHQFGIRAGHGGSKHSEDHRTVSLWSYMNQPELREKYINPFMLDSGVSNNDLDVDYSVVNMKIFKEVYLYYQLGHKDRQNYTIFVQQRF
ncbi:hypothetical protein PPERSA_09521 [Pseudocohnilembus persalinus]|uniref:Myotubularin phosphatase domain-containing protein n=1 Tax=Pseudocohnilembus persalinus TaxID=266149 RepID=A0A0V0QFD1_PSEPJ|nr:hypothetical protein PPERSA_09521 [Pseudocohnilembus persalinus]|eukprot:KRX00915.1 hypothetical protein PPERSA_09521 [Pseudocohnilembus persalinus]